MRMREAAELYELSANLNRNRSEPKTRVVRLLYESLNSYLISDSAVVFIAGKENKKKTYTNASRTNNKIKGNH